MSKRERDRRLKMYYSRAMLRNKGTESWVPGEWKKPDPAELWLQKNDPRYRFRKKVRKERGDR
jgi:hypothetical protein